MERNKLEHSNVMIMTHSAEQCGGEYCTIHNRSHHSMRGWPQHWRSDRGIMERLSPFSCGCPDPDQFDYWRAAGQSWQAQHGCVLNPYTQRQGVCAAWEIDGGSAAWLRQYGYAVTADGRVWSFWHNDEPAWEHPYELEVEKYRRVRFKDGTVHSINTLVRKAWGR